MVITGNITSKGPGGACVRRRGAPVLRHNGTMASPSLRFSSKFTLWLKCFNIDVGPYTFSAFYVAADATVSSDTLRIVGATQGSCVSLLPVRVDADGSAVQLQPGSFLLV